MSNVTVRFKNTTAANSGKLIYIVGSTGTNVALNGQQTTDQNVTTGANGITQTIKTAQSSNVIANVHNLSTTNNSIQIEPVNIVLHDGDFAKVNVKANASQVVSAL